jgi:phage host-nuclease inhibitor protein Gam
MAKKDTNVIELASFEQADDLLLELGQITANVAKEEASMNTQIQKARDLYAQRTEDALSRKAQIEKTLEHFCICNKQEFEKIRKRELNHGVVGFQTNPPKVALLNRKYNEGTVIELLKKLRLIRFVRSKEAIDKEAIIAAYLGKEIDDAKIASVGLRIDQAETFICEPKWEELSNVA